MRFVRWVALIAITTVTTVVYWFNSKGALAPPDHRDITFEVPPPDGTLSLHTIMRNNTNSAPPSTCINDFFEIHEDADFNQGPIFDIDSIERAKRTLTAGVVVSRFCGNTSWTHMESDLSLEPWQEFIGRCTAKCLSTTQHLCTGFVVRGLRCYLKKFYPMYFNKEASLTSFVRIPDRAGSDFVATNYVSSVTFNARLLFGVLAGPQYAADRLVPALTTWLCQSNAVVALENDAAGHEVEQLIRQSALPSPFYVPALCLQNKTFVYLDVPNDATERSFNGAWKNMPLLRYLARNNGSSYEWFAFVDDDTYIIHSNLNMFFTSVVSRLHNYSTAVAVGAIFTDGRQSFVQGGAGIFLSQGALFNMLETYQWCLRDCLSWAGDIRMGCCYDKAHVEKVGVGIFSSVDILHYLEGGRRPAFHTPASFHQLKSRSYFAAAHQAELRVLRQSSRVPFEHLFLLHGQQKPFCRRVEVDTFVSTEQRHAVVWEEFAAAVRVSCRS